MSDDRPVIFDEDNPEWTEEDFANARPISDFPELAAAFALARGRPPGTTKADPKVQIAIRIDRDVLDAFRAAGPGWQSRMNAALRAAIADSGVTAETAPSAPRSGVSGRHP